MRRPQVIAACLLDPKAACKHDPWPLFPLNLYITCNNLAHLVKVKVKVKVTVTAILPVALVPVQVQGRLVGQEGTVVWCQAVDTMEMRCGVR